MIDQEERQRAIGSQTSTPASYNGMAFATKNANNAGDFTNHCVANKNQFNNKNQTREMPLCTMCQSTGHNVDTCYKLHGYPPGYQPMTRSQSNIQSTAVNQTSNQQLIISAAATNNPSTTENFFQSLDNTQYKQLMAMFSNDLLVVDKSSGSLDEFGPSHSTFTWLSTSTPHSLISSKCWIIDSGASKHIFMNLVDFIVILPIQDSIVTLPNRTHIVVKFCGDVRLNSHLILKDV